MLWFAGFHEENTCNEKGTGYKNMYTDALNSAILNAGESLQPVLMLGRLGLDDASNTTASTHRRTTTSKIGQWAEARGAWVINVPRLSFQDIVDKHYAQKGFGHRQGPWLRLEIPRLIKEHGLMNISETICKSHVLYTDADVLFPNKLSPESLSQLVDTLLSDDATLMYGRESGKEAGFVNTGVMVLNVKKFSRKIPGMLQFLNKRGDQGAFDQGLVNNYPRLTRSLLPIHYNWKLYWKLEPSTFDQVKIIHLHGPKPGRGLEKVASCDAEGLPSQYKEPYGDLYQWGICCDKGRSAAWFMDSYDKLRAPFKDICEEDGRKMETDVVSAKSEVLEKDLVASNASICSTLEYKGHVIECKRHRRIKSAKRQRTT